MSRAGISSDERARIVAVIAGRFACYGSGTLVRNNSIARTLKDQPATFGFGVEVAAVVDAVIDELEAG